MKIYLDRNIYEDMRQNRNNSADLISKCQFLTQNGNIIFSSVIHAEEIATPYVIGGDTSYIDEEINFIDTITHKNMIFPSDYGFVELLENMRNRVNIVMESIEETRWALCNEIENKELQERSHNFCQIYDITNNNFSYIEPEKILNDEKICYLLEKYIEIYPLPRDDTYVGSLMTEVERLYDFLDIIKYYPIKIDKIEKVRSRMYDVGHVVYASHCDYLITNDKKMKIKAIAIYAKLKKNTKVFSSNDFFRMKEFF